MFEQFLVTLFYSAILAEENMVREMFHEPELSRGEILDWGLFSLNPEHETLTALWASAWSGLLGP